MKDMTSVTIYVMLRVMKNFWKSLQEYFNREIFRCKKIRTRNCSHENDFRQITCNSI